MKSQLKLPRPSSARSQLFLPHFRSRWIAALQFLCTFFWTLQPLPVVNSYQHDSNGDGISEEHPNPTDPNDSWWNLDSDGDNLTNAEEVAFGSDPYSIDSDTDSITDRDERDLTQTNPWQWDSNSDGFSDHDEFYGCYSVNYHRFSDPSDSAYNYPFYSFADADGDGMKNHEDYYPLDRDNDGIEDWQDGYPDDFYNGNYYSDYTTDSDGDGMPDYTDPYPYDSSNGYYSMDSDYDGTPDYLDSYPYDPSNGYDYGDYDNDGIQNYADPYPYDPNNGSSSINDPDSDGDGMPDHSDPYPSDPYNGTYNPYGFDDDNDGYVSYFDSHPGDSTLWDDWNGNGINDSTEPDTDGDGIIDTNDAYPKDPWNNADSDSDGLTDLQEIGFGSVQGIGTSAYHNDTDNDDLTDYEEVMIYKLTHPTISPTNPKSLSGVYLDYQMVDATDTDLDGIPDRIEQWYAANGEPMDYTNPADGGGDLDGDRINNRTAYEQGWSLIAYRGQYDSDLDRMTDAQEDYWSSIYPGSFNKNRFADAVEDYDQDGLFNYEELEQNLDPGNPHSKFTGITDGQYAAWQRAIGTPGYYGYLDGQPISTPPSHGEQADWDGDGIPEGYAAFVNDGHTVPNGPTHPVDQDNDGMSNEWEHRHQFDPRDSRDAGPATGFVVATEPTEGRNESTESEWQAYELAVLGDFDRDGLSNLREFLLGTHPKIADTDGDGINDGTEVQAGSNPTDINSEPTTVTPITPPRINLELSGIHLQGGTGSGNSGTGGGNSGGGSGNGSGNNNGPQPTEEELDNATRLTPFIVQYSGWKGGSISSAGGSYSPGTPEGVGMRPVASTAPSTPSTYTGYIQKYRYKQQGANDAPTPEPVGDPIEHAGLSGDSAAWITANSTPQPAYHIIKTSVEAQRELDGRFIQAHKILITTDSFNAPVNTQQEAIDEATYQNLNRNPEPTKYALGPVTTWQSAYTGGGPVENPEPGEPAMEEYIIEAVPEQNHPPTHTYTSPTPGWYGNLLSYPVQSQSEEHQGESVNLSPKLETLPNGDFFIKSVPIKWNGGPVAVAKNRLEEREIQYTGPGGEQTMTGYFGTAQHGKVRVIWTSEWGGMLDETTKAAWQSRYLVALVDVTEPHDQSGPQTIEYKWVKSLKEFMAQSQPTEIKAPAPFAAMLKSQALVLLPVELLVDHNRDGELNTSDNPTEEKPFRFWINNDDDPESNDELDDEPVAVSASNGGIHSPHIDGIRDLEDFTRLHLNVESILEMLKSGDMELGFKFVEGDGSPLIRIFNAVDFEEGSESYLKDKDKATEQCTGEFRQKLLSVGRYSQEYLPKTFWQSEKGNRPVAHFIWEASAKGKAKLVVMFRNKSGTESEACGVWLKLMDVHEMYQRARITAEPEEIDDPWDDDRPDALQWVWDPNGNPHVEDPDVEEKTLIFVHGWRMTYHDYDSWGQTTFKRLWQMGYKGRFYTFRWPTHSGDNDGLPDIYKPGATTYNPSEYRAWLSGPALANFVNQLPNANNRCLFAHSMGNVITGSALRNGMNLTRYALCNAAMAAQAYGDETVDFNFTTPDTDPDQSTKDQFGITDKFFEATPKTNFFLETDSALAVWETNNQLFKPNEFIIHAYAYRPGFPVGEKLIYGVVGASLASSRIVTQLSEAMGYVTKSRTKAAGTRACTTNTCITSAVNMGVGGFNFGDEHSAQWVYSIQKNYYFWLDIVTKFGFGIGNREP